MNESLMYTLTLAEPRKALILVVDDVPDNVQFLAARLRSKGYQVAAAANGADALRMIEVKPPDLILLDVQMPEMDGFEVCRLLKSNPETQLIPVIFLTARTEIEDIVEGLSLGAVDYITKPFHASELMTRVRTHLDLKFARDMLVEKNAELVALNDRLAQLNNEKNEFLSVAAHDLKNPLAAIRWLADMALRSTAAHEITQTEDMLKNILSSTERMFAIVTNLLDVNAIEEGKLNIDPEPVNLIIALADVVAHYEDRARQKNIVLHIKNELSSSTSNAIVKVNPDILSQVLENLISNAIKYSQPGKQVWISIVEKEIMPGVVNNDTEDNGENNAILGKEALRGFYIIVRDEGLGISEADMQQLFGKFARLSNRPTADEHSTGLGLFIVKKLVDIMGGKVWCESVVGEGSTFIVELPKSAVQTLISSSNADSNAEAQS